MPQCKRDGCKEQAIGTSYRTRGHKRKQYCPAHWEAYAAKQDQYLALQRSLPTCDVCGTTKVSKTRVDNGHTDCDDCARRLAAEAEYQAQQEAKRRYKDRRADELDACETVEDIKKFISTFLLK